MVTEEKQDKYRKFYVHGESNCIDLCQSMVRGEITGCFIEMNMCSGGCIKGPTVNDKSISRFKVKLDMEERISRDPVPEAETKPLLEEVSLHKVFLDRTPKDPVPSEEEIRDILAKTGKVRPDDELNCGACGYPTCREKAIAVYQKKAELDMCIPFMYEKSKSFANLVMETSPNVVLIVDADMKLLEYSAVGEKYFGKTRAEALQMYLYEFIDPSDFQWVFDTHQNIHGKKVHYPEFKLDTLQNIVYIPEQNVVLATFIDITKEEEQARLEYERKLDTIDLAQKVIHKQNPDFPRLMADLEIYVNGVAGKQVQSANAIVDAVSATIMKQHNPGLTDPQLRQLIAAHIDDDSFCRYVIQQDINKIALDLREAHKDDFFSVPEDNPLEDFLQTAEETTSPDSDPEQAAMAFICKRLKLNYGKLSEEERKWLKRIAQKSDLLKNPKPQRGRK